ncbi:MAG: hypothetical protein P4M09_25115 [Devosia sp.]|nr:hypothetical protein [Devosia sp.]
MLGDLIARLDRPEIVEEVLASLDPAIREQLESRAARASMTMPDFAAGAVREFEERADDDLWFQLLTLIRQTDEPGLLAVQTILRWVTEPSRQR